MSGKGFSRRAVTIGGGIAAALGITALGLTVPRLLRTHYRQSAYDDLLEQLIDRDSAVRVGQAVLDETKKRGAPFSAKAVARDLRQRLERRTLHEVTDSDLAQSNLAEVTGWVMPQTLTLLCALAAEES